MKEDNDKELKTLSMMIGIYCREKHSTSPAASKNGLCADCQELLDYARQRLIKCPYDPKPKCKDCATHCYAPKFRAKIKQVMRFSGTYMIKRGRLDLLFNYFIKAKLGLGR